MHKRINHIFWALISLLFAALLSAPLFFLLSWVFIYYFPPLTPDGHVVMATGQIMASLLITTVCGIIMSIMIYKRLKAKWKPYY